MHEFMQKFVKFDEDFEYGAQLPEMFLGWESFSKLMEDIGSSLVAL